jgi:hypothetical protein
LRAIVKICGYVFEVFPALRAEPLGDLDVALAVPGYFPHAQPLVERLGAAVDGEHVEDQVLAILTCNAPVSET